MARANAYDIVDVLYVDNINVRMAHVTHAEPFDFGTLPIQRGHMSDTHGLMTKAAKLFEQNLRSADTRAVLEKMAKVKRRRRAK